MANENARTFLDAAGWGNAAREPLTGDASARRYVRLRQPGRTAVLMDASRLPEIVAPFIRIDEHLRQLSFSAPEILARDEADGLLLLEDFGDTTFAQLLDTGHNPEELFSLATDVLVALHRQPQAAPGDLRAYSPEKMFADAELFLKVGQTSCLPNHAVAEFREVWSEVLPIAHAVPTSLLLRDYHAANLMLLPERDGAHRAGLLDFQDAYQGPITYDLVSLLEDARRDVPDDLRRKMIAHYLAQFPSLDRKSFETSMSILAALRHTRVLAIFEKLSHEGKTEYKERHSPRVERLLQAALCHPILAGVKSWFEKYARAN